MTQDGSAGGFAVVAQLKAQVLINNDVIELAPSQFSQETGIIVLELYIRNGQNKVRSVWQGFASGLAGLCDLYGIEVEEPAPVIAPKPTPSVNIQKSVVKLTKPESSHRVSLLKGVMHLNVF